MSAIPIGEVAAAAVSAVSHNSIISQVSSHATSIFGHDASKELLPEGNNVITLDLRGRQFVIQRDELMSLPESVLLCLFPNGVFVDGQGHMVSTISGNDVIAVDFSPNCLEYVINTFRAVSASVNPSPVSSPSVSPPLSPDLTATSGTPLAPRPASSLNSTASILVSKPAVIVLQEDLDYYVVPPKTLGHIPSIHPLKENLTMPVSSPPLSHRSIHHLTGLLHRHSIGPTDLHRHGHDQGQATLTLPAVYDAALKEEYVQEPPTYGDIIRLKLAVGQKLLRERKIFSALKRARRATTGDVPLAHGDTPEHAHAAGTAEKHLLDMLCSSGFNETDEWGFREREPAKTVISSLALVRLLAVNEPGSPSFSSASDEQNQHVSVNPMAQKLLLFWRKPARKCWWDQLLLKGLDGFDPDVEVKVHVRRMWTLELSVVGVR